MSATMTAAAPTSEPQIRVELRSNPLLLAGVREMVSSVAKRLGFTDEACGQIALAVDEALCNVIRHGYQRAVDRPIWLSVFALGGVWTAAGAAAGTTQMQDERPDALKIVIEDEARQVDPEQIRSRDLEEIRPGGLGVHIIKTVMDEAVYERRPGQGMRLTMVKKRNSATTAAGAKMSGGGGCCGGSGGGQANCDTRTTPGSEKSHG
ncbi:MAG: ATP-binding protein [Phycisphaerales bacterium]|nr:ATP-binding protein [Phycisphaerales bacterium]